MYFKETMDEQCILKNNNILKKQQWLNNVF